MKHRMTKVLNPDRGYACCFRNWRAPSHCHFLHGYDLIFEVTFEAEDLDQYGWTVDFGSLGRLKLEIEQHFDHKTIVAFDDPDLEWYEEGHKHGVIDLITMPQVSAEAFACWLAVRATDTLQALGLLDKVRVHSARVREHGANVGEYVP